MASPFVDKVTITVRAGDGGNGAVTFHREKYVAAGGPDGGDGGRGGDIIFEVDDNMSTLMDFRYKRKYVAANGADGQGKRCSGRVGQSLHIRVPRGTLLRDADSGAIMHDMSSGEPFVAARGGRGGWGNQHFATPTRQVPRFAKPGLPGESHTILLELKLLADVGLVGFPNVGKSTLLSVVSKAHPKIANYHFTTLFPKLGVVYVSEGSSFVMADIPGIIEGASAGKGLGLRFLRHIERNSLLLFMVPADSDDIRKEYEILLNELRTFNPEMLDKQRVLAVTKCDMLDQELMDEIEPTLPENIPHVFISAISGMGISVLKDLLWEELNKESNKIEGKVESIAHRAKDMSHLKEELKEEGEDEDLNYEYIDDEDIEDLEDFEYEEEDWEEDGK